MNRNFTFALLLWIPLIALLIICIKTSNWWYMFGLLAVFIGGAFATEVKKFKYFGIATGLALGYWVFVQGFKWSDYVTFFYLCMLFGFVLAIIGYSQKIARTQNSN